MTASSSSCWSPASAFRGARGLDTLPQPLAVEVRSILKSSGARVLRDVVLTSRAADGHILGPSAPEIHAPRCTTGLRNPTAEILSPVRASACATQAMSDASSHACEPHRHGVPEFQSVAASDRAAERDKALSTFLIRRKTRRSRAPRRFSIRSASATNVTPIPTHCLADRSRALGCARTGNESAVLLSTTDQLPDPELVARFSP